MTSPDPRAGTLRLRPPSERVSPKARLLWTTTDALRAVVVVAVLYVVTGPWDWFEMPTWLWAVIVVLLVAYAVVVPQWRYVVHRWEVTDTAVYTQTGWWARERRIAPMSRVQTVDHREGPLARLFGLSTVRVTTASSAGALHIEGLDRDRALAIVADLTSAADSVPGGRDLMDPLDQVLGWQRLDRRMLLVYPIRELGRYLVPLLVLVVFRRSSSSGGAWELLAIAIPIALGLLRYVTTTYRITSGRVEVKHGLLSRQVVSTPVARVRTVDLTASPIHRALGLVTVRVGTGQNRDKGGGKLDLDGMSVAAAERLRAQLLHAAEAADPDAPATPTRTPRRDVLRLDLGWVRFAPLTSSGVVIAGAALGLVSQSMHTLQWSPTVDEQDVRRLGVTLVVLVGLLAILVVLCLLAVVGYLVTNFGFVLSHSAEDGAWHLRRGLFTTRETSLDDARVSGVSIGEPLSLRLAGGARLSAIVTGLSKKQKASSVLVPPAPRAEVDRVAAEVLRDARPVTCALLRHGPRAVRRRWTRALVPSAAMALAAVAAGHYLSGGFALLAPLIMVVGVVLAVDRVHGLGHALVDGHLVARSGSLNRRREALATPSVIGWNLRSTWFQRRVGLTDLVATTAGGRQHVKVLDLAEPDAEALARQAVPGLLDPFLL